MTCELWRDQITSYVDGELAASHDHEVSQHLKQCGECTLYAASEIHLKRAVASAGRRYKPSAELRASVLKSIGATRKQSLWTRAWIPALATAALLLIAALGILILRAKNGDLNREIADIHLSTISSANPVDVISTDQHTVKPWFQGKLPFTFNLPELAGSQFTLIGGRVVYLRGAPSALLLFQYKLHRISVVISPDTLPAGSSGDRGGFHVLSWAKNGYRYTVVGDAATDILNDLSGRLRAVAGS
jgi:anti-sigma factor RsiW